MVHGVEVSYLHEPSTDSFHDFFPCLETFSPVRFPLEEITGMQCVRSQFEDATELAWGCGWPEREFLHDGDFLRLDEGFEVAVEVCELRVVLDVVQRLVVAEVSLVFPNVD